MSSYCHCVIQYQLLFRVKLRLRQPSILMRCMLRRWPDWKYKFLIISLNFLDCLTHVAWEVPIWTQNVYNLIMWKRHFLCEFSFKFYGLASICKGVAWIMDGQRRRSFDVGSNELFVSHCDEADECINLMIMLVWLDYGYGCVCVSERGRGVLSCERWGRWNIW